MDCSLAPMICLTFGRHSALGCGTGRASLLAQHPWTGYDLTAICANAGGLVLLVSYIGFAYLVTHSGDFYRRRRWKAAVWFAGVPTGIASLVLLYLTIAPGFDAWSSKSIVAIAGLVSKAALPILSLAIPLLLIITWGTHQQLKWWLNSDDFLDKIWKDPNKDHKNPVQDI